jgi:GNAT superfamily N-acetyltransferase
MIHVRDAKRSDAGLLMQLIREMGQHERLLVTTTEERLTEDGFGLSPRFHALIAEADAEVAGYALVFDCYSSFQGAGIFLEDLFVRDDFRGKGVGRALLSRIAADAVERSQVGIMFNVLNWNQPALRFFESAGASVLADRKTLCLAGQALRTIATSGAASPGGHNGGN